MYDLIGYLVHSCSYPPNKQSFTTCFESRGILINYSEMKNIVPALKFTVFIHRL